MILFILLILFYIIAVREDMPTSDKRSENNFFDLLENLILSQDESASFVYCV